jgi:hypothetical protein
MANGFNPNQKLDKNINQTLIGNEFNSQPLTPNYFCMSLQYFSMYL